MLRRVLASWWAPRRVVRGLSHIPERTLLAVVMLAGLIQLVAQAPGHARAAQLDPSIPLDARMGGALMGSLFMLPLLAYLVAGLTGLLLLPTRWRIDPRHARLALFWALLAVAPASLLAGLTAGFVGPGPALTLTRAVAGAGFILIWGAGFVALTRRK
ncbi:hypothetical protein KO490_03830 [Paracoccus sp. C2R09]|nr:hypothetical protein [Paracoccus sp. C2R09]MBU2956780.1 hypothetical protein [Paracoccus sp. C2R09]